MPLSNLIFEAIGKIIGVSFNIEAKKAQQIGEYAILVLIVLSVVIVTFKYS
jgi:hypothetical protein